MASSSLEHEQPFRTDLDYYEGRAHGIATTGGVSIEEARRDLAERHGFGSWDALRAHVDGMARGEIPPTPFVLAYDAVEENDRDALAELLDGHPDRRAGRGPADPGRAARRQGARLGARGRPRRTGRRAAVGAPVASHRRIAVFVLEPV